ncbi:MAG: HNH endonuclease [Actinobacteria bacterium]|nr:HNH endonuclease [Actinomycetota bacterium]
MPPVRRQELIEALLEALDSSGNPSVVVPARRSNPVRLIVSLSEDSVDVWAYIWNLTHGGRPSLPDEYRIQMTGVMSPLQMNPNGVTVLLGYKADLNAFAGFDVQKHRNFTQGSPSVQIDINALYHADANGLGFDRKGNDEIAVGIRPDRLAFYIQKASELHQFAGASIDEVTLLQQAADNERIAGSAISLLPVERQKILRTTLVNARSATFRDIVLTAYGSKCAVTRVQLNLLDASHILPVNAPGSSDDVKNGICLSPTYHRAFDAGLIYLDESFVMHLNPDKIEHLRGKGLHGGLVTFRRPLERPISMPPDRHQRPSPTFIRKANHLRQI